MSFTDRYITLPIRVYDRKLKEMTGSAEDEDSYMKLEPLQISGYRPSWDGDDQEATEIVSLITKTGDTILVYCSVEEFERRLNEHMK